MKLFAANQDDISNATRTARQQHHLTSGWVPSQSWFIKDEEGVKIGDAQVVVTNSRYNHCVAVIQLFHSVGIEVVVCRGLVEALTRIGVPRESISVG